MARPGFMVVHAILDILAGTPPEVVGAYVLIHQYIARKNLSGRMVGASRWTDGTWLSACRCRRRHVDALVAAGGAEWQGDDLVLDHYDQHGETKYGGQVKRVGAINQKRTISSTTSPPKSATISSTKSTTDVGGGTAGAGAGAGARAGDSTASSPSDLPARESDDDGDDEARKFAPHDQPAPDPEAAGPLPGPGSGHLTTAIVRRVDAVPPLAVAAAVKSGDLLALLRVFGATVDGYEIEWGQAADDMTLHALVALLAEARSRRQPIRLPSGLRAAREGWFREVPGVAKAELLALYGLKPPPVAAVAGAAP